jgi:general secretion pathway protein D
MTAPRSKNLLMPALPALALAACTTPNLQPTLVAPYRAPAIQHDTSGAGARTPYNAPASRPADPGVLAGTPDSGALSFVQYGEEQAERQAEQADSLDEDRNIIVNLSDVPAQDAVQHVLGQILDENYVLEATLAGNLSIHTTRPVSRSGALRLLSSALSSKNAILVRDEGFYRIIQGGRGDTASQMAGQATRFVAPEFVSAASLEPILAAIQDPALQVSVDSARNLIVLKGPERTVADAEAMIGLFDVNWMRGKSISATPVRFTSPARIVEELDALFGSKQGGPLAEFVRFVPLERLNTVITISQQRAYIEEAQAWIERLDRSDGQAGQRLYILPVENRPASEVGNILRDILAGDSEPDAASKSGLHPADAPAMSGDEMSGPVRDANMFQSQGAQPSRLAAPRIMADEANNTLVVFASPEQFNLLERAVSQIDRLPNQVFLEVTIAEVTLSDDLAFGLTWFFQSGEFSQGFTDVANGAVASQFPGFSLLFSGKDARAALSAVAGETDVKILSAPSLMVLDNRTATLQVGDQVPIVTQSAVSSTNPDAPIVNSVSLRDTGIILNVTPRVNAGGLVLLDIDQEVSNVVSTQSSGIDSPTIQQRRITTSVAVKNGSSIALAGLMRERLSDTETKVPFFGDLPFLGSAFRTKANATQRTELLVLISPRVVTSHEETELVTEDLIRRMQSLQANYFPDIMLQAPVAAPSAEQMIDEELLFSDAPALPVAALEPDTTGS